jgi:hypothetical protein
VMLEDLKGAWYEEVLKHGLADERVIIHMRPLKPEEVIGKPTRAGYPLLRGKEVMIQADLRGALGQAFTDEPSEFAGRASDLRGLPLDTNASRALLVAAINVTYAYLGLIEGTRHCRDSGPEDCAIRITEYLAGRHDLDTKVLMIGFQPAIAHHLAKRFRLFRVTDMDSEAIGKLTVRGSVESHDRNMEAIEWSDIVIATGSALVNGSIDEIARRAEGKFLYFYGVTIAAAAYELGLNRLCYESK